MPYKMCKIVCRLGLDTKSNQYGAQRQACSIATVTLTNKTFHTICEGAGASECRARFAILEAGAERSVAFMVEGTRGSDWRGRKADLSREVDVVEVVADDPVADVIL